MDTAKGNRLIQFSIDPTILMRKSIRLQDAGNRQMFADMNAAQDVSQTKPVIHESFSFATAPEAYRAMPLPVISEKR